MSNQDIGGDVGGHVVGGDLNVNHHYSGEPLAEPMLAAQKQILHQLIDDLIAISGEEKSHVWKLIHAKADVCSVTQITTKKYHLIVEFLDEKIANARAIKDRKHLISRVLRITEGKAAERDIFCVDNFGTTTLSSLDADQLVAIHRNFSCVSQPPHRPITWEILIKERGGLVFLIFFVGVISGMILK